MPGQGRRIGENVILKTLEAEQGRSLQEGSAHLVASRRASVKIAQVQDNLALILVACPEPAFHFWQADMQLESIWLKFFQTHREISENFP